ncbi:HECT-domain (ubiquitin-transferase) domain-containing protein [Hirsutella rhossiliensis]|uniref:HECT-type E3 ubiquitin transferase n=1 Tax=Hirsutella rhossiliensis TaxID=111463 RepID=A0A9P8MUW3_9HYPO|nr:HECT-domain (ubiquitin-transferase) domain-containing protein [Hirsutella rhossiliensis]KAH0961665.1 HECT-domain (ubiquitin-transferase) domain-containing protein [Hirsutella rhossiliensis]
MFSTFTGNSRRPRNVNLSGQAGNPFANTAWSPSLASSATKTVSDAQAERERRQLERQRLKAAGTIQRVWRGHKSRRTLADNWRATFDHVYRSASANSPSQRLTSTFNLLLAFFSARRTDDVRRVFLFARDSDAVDLEQISPTNTHPSRLRRLMGILVKSLNIVSLRSELHQDLGPLLKLIVRIVSSSPATIDKDLGDYFQALAQLSRVRDAGQWTALFVEAVATPLRVASESTEASVYKALAYRFLAHNDMVQFQDNIALFSERIDADKLSDAIRTGYPGATCAPVSKDGLLWLLAHFVDLGRRWLNPLNKLAYLGALFPQLSFLSSEISLRHAMKPAPEPSSAEVDDSLIPPLQPYISRLLLSLGDHDGISRLLRDFSDSLSQTSNHEFQGTSVLAGYILTLLQCFPASADDTRMRLFLEQIPSASGQVPTIKFLWQIMQETSVFQKLRSESEQPSAVLRRYLHRTSQLLSETPEEREWRIILLFLELYIFILRLSDDEDFISGMTTQVLQTNSSTSRLRSCSLPLEDVKALTIFLKNAAFTLHYKANELSRTPHTIESTTKSRLDSYLGADGAGSEVDLDGLRTILTTPLKMLYERDSRKHFLAPDDWLMPGKLEQEDFVSAVIAEEERQNKEEYEGSEEEAEPAVLGFDPDFGVHSTLAGQRLTRHLEILKHMPFVVPFETRVRIFRQFVQLDRSRRGGDNPFHMFPIHPSARHHARIRRGQLFEDAYKQFYQLAEGLKDPIQITFVDQFDTPEAGIDGGGVTKEFLTSVTEQGLLFPNPTAADTLRESLRSHGLTENDAEWREAMASMYKRFEFLGRIVGKCMYEGILVDLAFAGFFLLKWPSTGPKEENTYKGSINDLRDMDEGLYKGMLRLKNYAGDVSELGFDFTVEDQVSRPGEPVKTVTRKLISNGDQTPVNNDNRLLYVSYMARHRLVVQPSLQTTAFLRGLRAIIRPSWLSMFNQSELQRLVGGDSSEIDIADLRRNTVYSGLYEIGDDGEEHPTIKLFWKVMEGFTDAQRRDVLKYVSSTPRAPLLGFSQLRPSFSIRDGGTDEERLPSTSTCVNLLKLPRYTREERLREKLLYAVTSGAGFDLS